jgi:hypothetical protein
MGAKYMWATERVKKSQTKQKEEQQKSGKCIIRSGGAISWPHPLVVQNICWLALEYQRIQSIK